MPITDKKNKDVATGAVIGGVLAPAYLAGSATAGGFKPSVLGGALSQNINEKKKATGGLKTDDPKVKAKYTKLKESAAKETTSQAREAFSSKAKSFEQKYGVKKPSPGLRFASKTMGSPRKANIAVYGAAAGLGAGTGALIGAGNSKREENKVKKMHETDAFGVSKALTGDPGDKRNTKYLAAAVGGNAVAPGIGTFMAPVAYGIYRNSQHSKKKRARSVQRKTDLYRSKGILA